MYVSLDIQFNSVSIIYKYNNTLVTLIQGSQVIAKVWSVIRGGATQRGGVAQMGGVTQMGGATQRGGVAQMGGATQRGGVTQMGGGTQRGGVTQIFAAPNFTYCL